LVSLLAETGQKPESSFFFLEELDSPACDSQFKLIDVMQNGGNSIGPAAAIYKECTSLCHNFVEVQFYHYAGKANVVGGTLAKPYVNSMS
jgi:hypothetical protein